MYLTCNDTDQAIKQLSELYSIILWSTVGYYYGLNNADRRALMRGGKEEYEEWKENGRR